MFMGRSVEESLVEELAGLVGRPVVLDTAGSVVYLGTLLKISGAGFWLGDADLHDTSEGHATKEGYILEAKNVGIRVNRKHLFVLRSAVISLSALEDVSDS